MSCSTCGFGYLGAPLAAEDKTALVTKIAALDKSDRREVCDLTAPWKMIAGAVGIGVVGYLIGSKLPAPGLRGLRGLGLHTGPSPLPGRSVRAGASRRRRKVASRPRPRPRRRRTRASSLRGFSSCGCGG